MMATNMFIVFQTITLMTTIPAISLLMTTDEDTDPELVQNYILQILVGLFPMIPILSFCLYDLYEGYELYRIPKAQVVSQGVEVIV